MRKFFNTSKLWHSIRKFMGQQVSDDILKELISLGKSVGDKMLSFTVIQSRDQLKKLNIVAKDKMKVQEDVKIIKKLGKTSDFDIFYGAPTVILISVKEESKKLSAKCNSVIVKISEEAKKLGLAVNWNSFVKFLDPVKELSEIPEDHKPVYAISLGYAS